MLEKIKIVWKYVYRKEVFNINLQGFASNIYMCISIILIYVSWGSGYIIKRVLPLIERSVIAWPKLAPFLLSFPSEFTYFTDTEQYPIKDRVIEECQQERKLAFTPVLCPSAPIKWQDANRR